MSRAHYLDFVFLGIVSEVPFYILEVLSCDMVPEKSSINDDFPVPKLALD